MSEVIATLENTEYGIIARVAKIDRGYSVTVYDTDAEAAFPSAIIYPEAERAIAKAKEVAA